MLFRSRRTLEEMNQTDEDLTRAIALMDKHGSLRDSVERARHYGAIARDALGVFADCAEKRALVEIVDFAINRAH